jgi:hypothetical protein
MPSKAKKSEISGEEKRRLSQEKEMLVEKAAEIYLREQEKDLGPGEHRKGYRVISEEVVAAHRVETGQDIKITHVTVKNCVNGMLICKLFHPLI